MVEMFALRFVFAYSRSLFVFNMSILKSTFPYVLYLSQAYESSCCWIKKMRRNEERNGKVIMLDRVVDASWPSEASTLADLASFS